MNNIWRYLAFTMALILVVSCDKNKDVNPNGSELSVNYKTVESVWQLDKIDGVELNDETYFYIEFVQKSQEFSVYENLNSSFANHEFGLFSIDLKQYGGYYEISGTKSFHFNEAWSESYYITSLTKTSMEWTGINYDEVLTFKRGADVEIPEEVLNGTKAL